MYNTFLWCTINKYNLVPFAFVHRDRRTNYCFLNN